MKDALVVCVLFVPVMLTVPPLCVTEDVALFASQMTIRPRLTAAPSCTVSVAPRRSKLLVVKLPPSATVRAALLVMKTFPERVIVPESVVVPVRLNVPSPVTFSVPAPEIVAGESVKVFPDGTSSLEVVPSVRTNGMFTVAVVWSSSVVRVPPESVMVWSSGPAEPSFRTVVWTFSVPFAPMVTPETALWFPSW